MNVMLEIDKAMDELDFSRAIRLINGVAPHDFETKLYECLGYIYKIGNQEIEKDSMLSRRYYKRFYSALEEMAENGDAKSAHKLAQGYQYGDNIEKNEEKAVAYYEVAANAGEPISQFHLGCIYLYGWCGVSKNDRLYEYWLDKAVENEWPEALFEKSKLLRQAGSLAQADDLLSKAARFGFWPANHGI